MAASSFAAALSLPSSSAKGAAAVLGSSRRIFRFVPYGASASSLLNAADGKATTTTTTTTTPGTCTTTSTTTTSIISCDGRVPGATFELTHWTGNVTPDDLYADTSTEMALNLAMRKDSDSNSDSGQQSLLYPELDDAIVVNNHYDTDGVLSVFACLYPQEALLYRSLLVAGAEAGDFSEWSSDAGVKLDCAISAVEEICENEEAAYERVLQMLPDMLRDMDTNDGRIYESLWKTGFDHALAGWNDLVQGRASLSRGPGKMVLVHERPHSRLSPYALHRGLQENNLWKDTTRILRIDQDQKDDESRSSNFVFRYEYEKVGHGWVQKLVDRPCIPDVDGSNLAQQMGNEWTSGGRSGLISICKSQFLSRTPDEVSQMLWRHDVGSQ